MWSLKKSTFVNGPNLDNRLKNCGRNYPDEPGEICVEIVPYCTATLNRSHFVMIAYKHYQQDPLDMPNRRFALVDFQTQKITEYPSLPFQGEIVHLAHTHIFREDVVSCSASIMHIKSNEKSVVVHLKMEGYTRHLMSYDLNQGLEGQWKFHRTWETDYGTTVLNFWQLRGSFYSLLSNGNFIHHPNLYD